MADRPIGQLFSDVYRDKGEPRADSQRFRTQFGAFFEGIFLNEYNEVHFYLKQKCGIAVPTRMGHPQFEKFFSECPIVDLLDCTTHLVHFLHSRNGGRGIEKWIKNVQFAFDTQNLAYEIDEAGGVHHKIDPAYAHSKVLTLTCLAGNSFAAAHDEIQKAFDFLTQTKPDTKLAVVNVFLAAESVFKITTVTNNSLTSSDAKRLLSPLVQKRYAGTDEATKQASARLVSSFSSWADACHPYRHGQQDFSIIAPPTEIAIALVTAGADFIRWLVQLSKMTSERSSLK